jgi:predicted RNase H-like nuclease (RuvC/YqgF family)
MSDTPISDSTPHNVAELGMLCRRIERQLNEANERIKELEAKLDELHDLEKWLEGR